MNVELISYSQRVGGTNNPAEIVEQAASVCYDSKPTETYRIAKGCAASGHLSVWEHISFTFHVSGVSRALLAQLTRHRHASFSVRSQRYCREDEFEYVNPFDGDARQYLDDDMGRVRNDYGYYVEDLGVAPEDARMLLPNACCTELYITMNARALIEASRLRLCNRAQKEIRQLFHQMKLRMYAVCPEVADLMRPSCERNKNYPYCTERESCGRHPKLKDVYKIG